MENLIEHEGKKYLVVKDPPLENDCEKCSLSLDHDLCEGHDKLGFPDCFDNDCHFELVTNQKE